MKTYELKSIHAYILAGVLFAAGIACGLTLSKSGGRYQFLNNGFIRGDTVTGRAWTFAGDAWIPIEEPK